MYAGDFKEWNKATCWIYKKSLTTQLCCVIHEGRKNIALPSSCRLFLTPACGMSTACVSCETLFALVEYSINEGYTWQKIVFSFTFPHSFRRNHSLKLGRLANELPSSCYACEGFCQYHTWIFLWWWESKNLTKLHFDRKGNRTRCDIGTTSRLHLNVYGLEETTAAELSVFVTLTGGGLLHL